MKKVLLTVSALLATASAYMVDFNTAGQDNHFMLDYDFDTSDANNIKLKGTFKLHNYNVSTWTSTAGTFGLLLGIGFNTTKMYNADMIICTYAYKNLSTDAFSCGDFNTNDTRYILPDSI